MVLGRVIRTVIGAVFGAVFGFIVGWVVELFPRFNTALLDGLHGLTGIGGVRMAGLLAAIGFIVGILAGLLSGRHHHDY
jgi:MFS family permease